MRDKNLRYSGISREGNAILLNFRDADTRAKARKVLEDNQPDLIFTEQDLGANEFRLTAHVKPEAQKRTQEFALQQNITTLHNRINELGVAEPVIQQQGADRVVVQLPGVQDTAKAKDILGRTATLEIRMVDEANSNPTRCSPRSRARFRSATSSTPSRDGSPLLVKKQVVLTGDRITDAQPGFDSQTHEPAVHINLDGTGARIFKDVTRENVGKRMAILLIEKRQGRSRHRPGDPQRDRRRPRADHRAMTTTEATDVALLLRAGALAAPMEIIEERTVGPSLGADNISKGFHSTLWGFTAIAVFMMHVLPAVRPRFGAGAVVQPAAAGGAAVACCRRR